KRVVVLGVEETRILYCHHGRLAQPLDTGWTEIDYPGPNELVHARDRLRLRTQHRFAQVHSGFRKRERVCKEYSLADFDSIFLALHQRTVGVDLLPRRR